MTAPKEITGPDDLARTVRNATDPLDEYPNYGTAANPPGDKTSRPDEMSELIEERGPNVSTWDAACEEYIVSNPFLSVAVAAGAGAAAAALLILAAGAIRDRRW
jgi:hypothetical protein